MNDFEGLLSSDYGFKPSGKSTPMAPSKPSNSSSSFNFDLPRSKTTSSSSPFLGNQDNLLRPNRNSDFPNLSNFDDVFTNSKSTGGNYNNSINNKASNQDTLMRPNRKSDFPNLGNFDDVFSNSKSISSKNNNKTNNSSTSVNFESIFGGGGGETATLPVFDKPVYDDDVVSSSPVKRYDDIFASKKSSGGGGSGGDAFDHLLGGLGKKEPLSSKSTSKRGDQGVSNFDDLLPGFGVISSMNRSSSDASNKSSSVLDDPFVVLESTSHHVSSSTGGFPDPLEEVGNLNNSGSKNFENSSSRGVFDDIDALGRFAQSVPPFSAKTNGREKDESPLRSGSRVSGRQTSAGTDGGLKSSKTSPERGSERKVPLEDSGESPHCVFEMPSVSADSSMSVPNASSPAYNNTGSGESNTCNHVSPPPEQNMGSFDEVWLTVSEIPLFTQPTAAPPPSRPPPPRPGRFSRAESGSFTASNGQWKKNEYSSFHGTNPYFHSPKSAPAGAMGSFASSLDEVEQFASGRSQSNMNENSDVHSVEDFDTNSVAAASAAAMKDAMDRAEAKFRHARGVREKESSKAFKSRESTPVEKEEKAAHDAQDREFREGQERLVRERQQREREEENRRQKEEEDRRRIEKEREEKEREKRRVERERELARLAVERATREARERAAIEARTRAERAAVQKAHSEARERAERAAVQRAQAEARERAAANAKERAEKAAAEGREKARYEAREKESSEKVAAASRASQQNEPDFDSIFGVGSRASSAPRPRTTSSDPFETQSQGKPAPEATRTSVNSASSMRKTSSATSIVDDLSSIFGAPSSSGDFQDVDGETDDRRRARLERHQRTQERAAKALAEKNARDLEAQREQAERHRISETLDVEIKRWAAGKEGNLRALLSTLQYVLWPECGWQPVSLTDLITGASVKKVYRKATLCIHPDKVQQKGANLQQKYVAEKVFDLLKEAWNKFNSEELF